MNKLLVYLVTALTITSAFTTEPRHDASILPLHSPSGDTVGFTPNKTEQFETILLYFDQVTPDSLQFELVVSQKTSKRRDEEVYIGTITNPDYRPKGVIVYEYLLLRDNIWSIRVNTHGDCYIKQQSGSLLKEKPFVFPFKMRYKNK